MAKSKPTLFEQLREDERSSSTSGGSVTSVALRVIILIGSTLLLMVFLPGRFGDLQRPVYDISLIGTGWTEESVVADYPFPVPRHEEAIERDRALAVAQVPAVVRRVSNAAERSRRTFASRAQSSQYLSASPQLRQRCVEALNALYRNDIIDKHRVHDSSDIITELTAHGEELIKKSEGMRDSVDAALSFEDVVSDLSDSAQANVLSAMRASIIPTLRIDDAVWSTMKYEASASVPLTHEIVQRGDVIVRKGQKIDQATLWRLTAYRNGQVLRGSSQFSFLVALGAFGHAFVLIAMIALYLYYVRRSSFERNGQLVSLLSMPVLSAGLGWLTIDLPLPFPLEYVIFVPGLAMITSILYDVRTSIVVTLVCSLAVAAARGNDHVIAVVMIAGGAMGAYSATNLRRRTQVFASLIAIFAGLAVVTLSIELERSTPLLLLTMKLAGVLANSIVSPLIALGVIIVLERAVGLATDLRLEDFDDINHPLLQQLNERAPGTYQHTMAVVRLSESAAAAIGANALLARVGALYHDVGKLEKSEYFIENQIDIDNKHDRLTAKKSASIIRQHVQDGIELAKEYKLPERIWKFIPMHHGTILIKHFYAKAVEDADQTGAVVDEQAFRYPGPQPDSKEAGIVMLADAAEALSRLVDTSQREEIERAIDTIVVDRMSDGQLGKTPLTMSDLGIIKESFIKSLLGSSHQRIRYKSSSDTSES